MNVHPRSRLHDPNAEQAAEGVARSDALATNSAANRHFYQARVPIYPKLVHGDFRRLKWLVMALTLGVYYLLPWVRWDRGPGAPNQAVLVDLAHERFYFFFIEIWPQEVYYITGLLIMAAVSIFLVTALFGRLWCGYTCPQTVWTDLFIYVEHIIEGDRSARIRLTAEPWWHPGKIVKRLSKHAIWLLIAAATGGAWVFYYADAPTLALGIFTGTAPAVVYTAIGVLTFTTYSLGGLMREQVCTFMCPWPRIQGAMTDADALVVTYRRDRGEPRGPHKKGQPWYGRGACIDCNQCVAACPMGIDIRDGTQLECINCALCIDACDEVMTKIGLPKRLIAYDSDANVERRINGQKPRYRFVRPRTVLYALVLLFVGSVMAVSLETRKTLDLDVLRDRIPNYIATSDGSVRNAYTLKLMNRTGRPRELTLDIQGVHAKAIDMIGVGYVNTPVALGVEADKVRTLRVLVTLAPHDLRGPSQPIRFVLSAGPERQQVDTVFISGGTQ